MTPNPWPSRIAEILRLSGLKRADVCAELKIDRPALSKWERGHHKPNGDNAVMIIRYLEKLQSVALMQQNQG